MKDHILVCNSFRPPENDMRCTSDEGVDTFYYCRMADHSLEHELLMTRVDYFIANTIINRSGGKGIDVEPRMEVQWSQRFFSTKDKQMFTLVL